MLPGEWHDPRRPPAQLWPTGLMSAPVAPLRLTKLTRRVDRDFTQTGEEVGPRDFVGRSTEAGTGTSPSPRRRRRRPGGAAVGRAGAWCPPGPCCAAQLAGSSIDWGWRKKFRGSHFALTRCSRG